MKFKHLLQLMYFGSLVWLWTNGAMEVLVYNSFDESLYTKTLIFVIMLVIPIGILFLKFLHFAIKHKEDKIWRHIQRKLRGY